MEDLWSSGFTLLKTFDTQKLGDGDTHLSRDQQEKEGSNGVGELLAQGIFLMD